MTDRAALRGVIARLDVDEYVERVERGIAGMPEYRLFVEGQTEQADRGRAGIRRNVEMFLAWAADGREPTTQELDDLRELVGARAAEGRPPAEGLAVYRRAMGAAWEAVLESADERERAQLGGALDVLLDWLDIVSRAFEEAYAQEDDVVVTRAERQARRLLERIEMNAPLGPDEHLEGPRRPLVAALPGGSPAAHLHLASDLRAQGFLAVAEGRLVVALTGPGDVRPRDAAVAHGPEEPPAQLGEALADLRAIVRMALEAGETGEVDPDGRLPELLALRSPRLAARLDARVFGPLDGAGRDDLARTLELLASHGFERAATATALPVHRNTLVQRLARIGELTGLDVDDPADRGTIWLATRARGVHRAHPPG